MQTATFQNLLGPSQELGGERHRSAVSGTVEARHCNDRATDELVSLYRQLRAASAGSDDFELLSAQFNRACQSDPQAVVAALRMEAFA